ncbi:hypothetical protein VPH35_072845 [Triticum aestivum]
MELRHRPSPARPTRSGRPSSSPPRKHLRATRSSRSSSPRLHQVPVRCDHDPPHNSSTGNQTRTMRRIRIRTSRGRPLSTPLFHSSEEDAPSSIDRIVLAWHRANARAMISPRLSRLLPSRWPATSSTF